MLNLVNCLCRRRRVTKSRRVIAGAGHMSHTSRIFFRGVHTISEVTPSSFLQETFLRQSYDRKRF